jgi:hypothetical protein
MSHDKIKAAARKRMAETGESYAAARREVIREFQAAGSTGTDAPAGEPKRFAVRYDGSGPFLQWIDTVLGAGSERRAMSRAHVEIDADWLRCQLGDFKVDVPRASVLGAARSSRQVRGTIGVHSRGGSWLVNGSADGLVEITIDPPCRTERGASTLFRRMKVNELIVSLVDPDGFIAAVSQWLAGP